MIKKLKLIFFLCFVASINSLNAQTKVHSNNYYPQNIHESRRETLSPNTQESKVENFKSKIDIDKLIKNKLPLFTSRNSPNINFSSSKLNYEGIGEITDHTIEFDDRFVEGSVVKINRSENLTLYPIKKINDFLILCESYVKSNKTELDVDGNEKNESKPNKYLININIADALNEILEYPNDINLSNLMLIDLTNYLKIDDINEVKCLLEKLINYDSAKKWQKNEFLAQDLIQKKIDEVKNTKINGSATKSEYRLEFKTRLENYNFKEKGFSFELGRLIFFSKDLSGFPFDLELDLSSKKINFRKDHLEDKNLQSDAEKSTKQLIIKNLIFHKFNEPEARRLVENLNENRDVIVILDLKIDSQINPKQPDLCSKNNLHIPFKVTKISLAPYQSQLSMINNLSPLYEKNKQEVLLANNRNRWSKLPNYQQNKFDEKQSEPEETFIDPDSDKAIERVEPTEPPKIDNEIKEIVEEWAEFPGGHRAFNNFFNKNVIYPTYATRASVGGRVTVQFVVNTDGTIQDIKVLKSVGFGLDEEAVRIIKSVPSWTPGKQSGRSVRSRLTQTLVFNCCPQ